MDSNMMKVYSALVASQVALLEYSAESVSAPDRAKIDLLICLKEATLQAKRLA